MFNRNPGGQWERWVHRELLSQLQAAGKLETPSGPAKDRYVRAILAN
jgi:hypothetical protein